MTRQITLLDSITDVSDACAGAIAVSGSHGGIYPATVASRAGLHSVIFNDAGVGFESAGIAGVMRLADMGMAAATVDCHSCRIGSASHMMQQGLISQVNTIAASTGVTAGMTVAEAVFNLRKAPEPEKILTDVSEQNGLFKEANGLEVYLLDSASMVSPIHAGKIVVTGSHGALIGGNPKRALKAAAHIAVFNDAGIGYDQIGLSRLPALDLNNIAAVTVDCNSAHIGDARSAYEHGIISAVNVCAAGKNAVVGKTLKQWLVESV